VVNDRTRPAELVCVDCGRFLNADEALEIYKSTRPMKVCPSCTGQIRRIDGRRE
jgi:rRNA maturation endonuclease Nob1